jgi:hypothetical protein
VHRVVGGGLLLFLASLPARARGQSADFRSPAQPIVFDAWDQAVALTGDVGFGTPLGNVGAEIDYSPLSFLAIQGGIGVGKGLQAAGGVRVRPARGNVTAFGIGVGFSLGHSDLVDPSIAHPESAVTYEYRPGYFVNIDLFVEHRWSSHFVMREFLGYARVLNRHPDAVCPDSSSSCRSGEMSKGLAGTPYIGMAFGYFWGGTPSAQPAS